MSRDTLLSVDVGVPLAVVAMLLLFVVEAVRRAGRRPSILLTWAAMLTSVCLVVLVVARFAEYA